eukprot:TRINITY_DN2799_c0_g1_i1.p1 TRINITY_DN2799_c0_g1~~TRINITY_DN2799_c0_g1_i1.p1  ORF type:complete len:521 (+),score=94.30 TRINITY_DN2799_c0_g1_i1:37-1599(+)
MTCCSTLDFLINELVDSERKYVQDLQTLSAINEEIKRQGLISSDQISTLMFDKVRTLSTTHRTLFGYMEARKKELGSVFNSIAPYFKLYVPYCQAANKAQELLTQLQKNSTFVIGIRNIMNSVSCTESLTHLQSQPTKRITYYIQTLDNILDRTPKADPDFPELQKAIELLQAVSSQIEISVSKSEKVAKVMKILDTMSNVPGSLMSPGREFISEGPVKYCNLDNFGQKQFKDFWIFLFTDIIILAKDKGSSQKKDFGMAFNFSEDVIVQEIANGGSVLDAGFYMADFNQTLTLSCSKYDKVKWVKLIKSALNDHIAKLDTLGRNKLIVNPAQKRVRNIKASIVDHKKNRSRSTPVGSSSFIVYVVLVETERFQYLIRRRYSEFLSLKKSMDEKYEYIKTGTIPSKHVIGNMNEEVIISRKIMLESFMIRLLSHPVLCLDELVITFLTPGESDSIDASEYLEPEPEADKAEDGEKKEKTPKTSKTKKDIAEYLLELAGLKDKYTDMQKDKYLFAPSADSY